MSMTPEEIKAGDAVQVNINNAKMTLHARAKVVRVPRGPGDSWVFSDIDDQRTTHVSEGCTVTLIDLHKNNDLERGRYELRRHRF